MRRDAVELERFYRTRQGAAAQRMITRRLDAIWPDTGGLDVLGIGYASPYLVRFKESARRAVSFMPAQQGAIIPGRGAVPAALGDEMRLPFAEALFDRVLLVHALEEAESLQPLLREVWRVMAPEGRLAIVTAARAGIWAWLDSTPFGHGRPFSKGQLVRLLEDAMLEPTAWSRALYAPPWGWSTGPRLSQGWESVGETLWPGLGGLILVEAVKHTGAIHPRPAPAGLRARALDARGQPALSPHPAGSASNQD
ncbi:class I SAM-dependent methyltransferase [Maricaulis sp. CAU 1757]